jgi:Raf kinase inhibitor-like YbhB/YbcL family protein
MWVGARVEPRHEVAVQMRIRRSGTGSAMGATMMRAGVFLALAALAACSGPTDTTQRGAGDLAMSPPSASTTGGASGSTALALSSSAFPANGAIPSRYTCEGANLSPPLSWSGIPEGARSLALVVEDPDAPSGAFCHWAAFDIPPDRGGLDEGSGAGRPGSPYREGVNGFGKSGYGGPCPPPGSTHHYHFRLFALRDARLSLPKAPRCEEVLEAARASAIGQGELVGTFARQR